MAQSSGQSKQQQSSKPDDEHAKDVEHVEPVTEVSKAEEASAVREVSQNQPDRVAMVSRTSTGQAHQSPDYEVVGLPKKPSEEHLAAAENRPLKGKG